MPNKVSIYPHIKETKTSKVLLISDIYENIKSDLWSNQITALRQIISAGATKKDIEILKQKLPYFTGSGTFSVRNDAGLLEHSGRIIIDFDNLNEYTDITAAKGKLLTDKYTEALFLSCSGKGFAVAVKIDPSNHLDCFLFLDKYYLDTYNLIIDKSCKDISRPRYISHDPDLFYNPNSDTVTLDVITAPVGGGINFDNSLSIDTDEGKYQWCKAVHDKKQTYTVGNRHNYLVILSFFLNKAGVNFEYAQTQLISEFSNPEKTPEEISKILRHCYDKGTEDFGTFKINKAYTDMPPQYLKATKQVYAQANSINRQGRQYEDQDIKQMAAQYDLPADIVKNIFKTTFDKNQDEFDIDNKPEICRVEVFIKKRWEIYKNEITHRTEGRRKAESGKPLDFVNIDEISREIMHAQMKFPLDKLKSLLRSEFVPSYNPFKAYFESLAPHDGNDYIDYLAQHVTCDNQLFWQQQFKKALVRNISCALDLRVNRIIMTLVGEKEETGKSSFIKFLCPPALNSYYTESTLDSSKDSDIQLSENFFWNLEELAALSAIEINKLKAIISKPSVKQRGAYKEFAEVNPRRVNFWAATNKLDFLTDDQNTRWLCFGVQSINFDYNNVSTGTKNVDINKVWAQAYHLYKTGFDFNLSQEEINERGLINKDYESSSMEKELIIDFYKPVAPQSEFSEFMTNSQILMKLSENTNHKYNLNIYAIARAMKQLEFKKGVKKVSGKTCRGYWLQERTTFDKNDVQVTPQTKIF